MRAATGPPTHAAVRYRGHWFWIAGDDVASKRMFLVAQILLSLNDTSGSANAPVVTIPTGYGIPAADAREVPIGPRIPAGRPRDDPAAARRDHAKNCSNTCG